MLLTMQLHWLRQLSWESLLVPLWFFLCCLLLADHKDQLIFPMDGSLDKPGIYIHCAYWKLKLMISYWLHLFGSCKLIIHHQSLWFFTWIWHFMCMRMMTENLSEQYIIGYGSYMCSEELQGSVCQEALFSPSTMLERIWDWTWDSRQH